MTTNSLDSFNRRITDLANRLDDNRVKTIRRLAMTVDQAVVLATPVDTGRARANWITSVGVESRSEIEPYSAGTDGSTGAANAQSALDQCKTAVAGYTGTYGQVIYITNNLPYIEALNNGHSAQAPQNFVEAGVQAAQRALRNNRLLPP